MEGDEDRGDTGGEGYGKEDPLAFGDTDLGCLIGPAMDGEEAAESNDKVGRPVKHCRSGVTRVCSRSPCTVDCDSTIAGSGRIAESSASSARKLLASSTGSVNVRASGEPNNRSDSPDDEISSSRSQDGLSS